MNPVRIGLIGTGGISHWHTRQLLELEEATIAAIADPGEESRRRWTSAFGLSSVPQYGDYAEMLEREELDAVVICSPHTQHYEQAKACLEKGLHVLVEKPMTCSSAEAESLLETADASGRVLQVSYQRHFQPEFLYIKQAIEQGAIGRLTSVNATLYQDWSQGTTGTWRQNPSLSGGGMLMDSGSHIVDVLLWTTGLRPEEVKAFHSRQGTPVEIDSFTTIRFEGGVVAGLNIVGLSPCWYESYIFAGDQGAIFMVDGSITLRRRGKEPEIPTLPKQTTNQDKSFVDAILGRHEIAVPGSFALEVVRLTERIYEAAGYHPFD
ncbi:Gfo/Idh/MocA family oxidoreductase [Paenibacillus cisolokensis]|jgi:predicted dehydrogenase|uniref:Dehydrogenase n=1 Tax=Paenibacillus cisolokensis TaxID=1658519 RepID=A0ABQ4ND71_9BACL|nr:MULTISPECIES: Gfo/Idh/MocA family oxidoreductase [Paenibacillus]ALS28326.1 oxidoreductase [Paenibacillus sp. 32O-W]GIQ66195.1 dehydrogenase [Paenibacillus cisolokensis]